MKKFKNFLLSLVIPHRMVRFKDMSIFITLVLILFSFIGSVFSNNARMASYVKNDMFYQDFESITDSEVGFKNVTIKYEKDATDLDKDGNNKEFLATFTYPDESNGVFNKKLNAGDFSYDVTFVFSKVKEVVKEEGDVTSTVLENFDVSDYVNYHKAHREENTIYMLYVFTDSLVYNLYNLGEEKVNNEYVETYELYYIRESVIDENANIFSSLMGTNVKQEIVYYVPNINEDGTCNELIESAYVKNGGLDKYNYNTSLWSKKATSDEPVEVVVDGVPYSIKPVAKLGSQEGNKIYTGLNHTLFTAISYENLFSVKDSSNFKFELVNSSLKEFMISVQDSYVFVHTDGYKAILMIINLFIFILIPLLFALFAWLFTRKRGMKKFKSYINIMSIIEFYLAIIFFILGWFVNILNEPIILFAGLLMMLWYFIFVIYQITIRIEKENKEKDNDNNNSDQEELPKEEQKVEFKKIDEDYSVIG